MAADHGGPTDPATGDFTFDISVQADLTIDCAVQGAGVTTNAFLTPGQVNNEGATNVTFGQTGLLPGGNLFGWLDGGGLWYVGGEALLDCQQTGGLTAIDVQAFTSTTTGGAEGFFNDTHSNLSVTPPTFTLTPGPTAVFTGLGVPVVGQQMGLGTIIDSGDAPTAGATIILTFIPS
ncbi:MAG: hypothetical protein H6737_26365 [Alphaproteobacteria bacterium]|nr:hypothetical protein [Alphaproteobacteria bacterium]